MFWFFAIPMLFIGGMFVITVLIISYYEIQDAIRRYKEEKDRRIVAGKIRQKLIDGDYHIVKVDLLDRYDNKVDEIAVKAEEDANDYYVGQKIPIPV